MLLFSGRILRSCWNTGDHLCSSTRARSQGAQLLIYGAQVFSVQGTYDEAWELCMAAAAEFGWYNRNCAINPYLIEGKKTVSWS